jgi:hypothetical protein
MVELKLPPNLYECPQFWKNYYHDCEKKGTCVVDRFKKEKINWNGNHDDPIVYFKTQEDLDFFKVKWALGNG